MVLLERTRNPEIISIRERLLRWDARFDIAEILLRSGVRDVAIYGGGEFGQFFAKRLLENGGVNLSFVIDQGGVRFPYPVPVYRLDDIPKGAKPDAVLMAVHSLLYKEYYWHHLRERLGCEVIRLEDLVLDVYKYDWLMKADSHVRGCGGRMLLLDYRPPLWRNRDPSPYESALRTHSASDESYDRYPSLAPELHFLYDDIEGCDEEYLREISKKPAVVELGGISCLGDIESRHWNVVQNIRLTAGNPERFDGRILIFGNCIAAGEWTSDDRTIASFLQRKLLEAPVDGKTFCVQNRSNWTPVVKSAQQICRTVIQPGDWVVLINKFVWAMNRHYAHAPIRYHEITPALQRPHDMGEIFIDGFHVNHRGYKLLADRIHAILSTEAADKGEGDPVSVGRKFSSSGKLVDAPEALHTYLAALAGHRRPKGESIGSLVMNCNPFTLGHRHVIEKALEQCDHLFLFVVEEDKSHFPFRDRLDMVKLGTADLPRATVLPSGSFILSNATLPEYFRKDSDKAVIIDASRDMHLFGGFICPALSIVKRFAGEEPLCAVTRQYNQTMREILPRYGVETIVFERLTRDGEPVSASKVRALLQTGNREEARLLVPEEVYAYLAARFLEK